MSETMEIEEVKQLRVLIERKTRQIAALKELLLSVMDEETIAPQIKDIEEMQ